jgi:hypothetical protein
VNLDLKIFTRGMYMKKITGVLLLGVFAVTLTTQKGHAQSIHQLQMKYAPLSPLKSDTLEEEKMVDPNKSYLTPAEEELAEIKAKQEEEKKAREEKLYLDTDYRFFQALNVTIEEDDMDRAYKQALALQNVQEIKGTDKTVKTELKTIVPQTRTLTPAEAAADARREAILKKIAANVKMVKSCIMQNRKDKEPFKGTELTLAWEVETSGKVINAQVKATDVENKEIQGCILKSLAEWNFNDVMKDIKKTSHIEYTYRFMNNPKKDVASQ